MKEAMLWEKIEAGNLVRCNLCHHFCKISDGEKGLCGVRENKNGTLYTLVYGNLIAESVDPIEKKPLFHFLPGSLSYSIATVGCNFTCKFCQNADISQAPREGRIFQTSEKTPEEVVEAALSRGCQSISYTYTEPTIFFEFAYDTAKIAKKKGLKNTFITNGYMSKEAIKLISPYLDAANIDFKGDDGLYRKLCGAKMKPIPENIKLMKKLGIWIEVTTLLIPEYNDSDKQIKFTAGTIADIDKSIPWHISRFYPAYKMADHYPTAPEKIQKAREIGLKAGLKYVYSGNMPGDDGENTFCPACKKKIIGRIGFSSDGSKIKNGKCPYCGEEIDGVFR
jgi:pyruvate formate lyase activating enzyme